MTYEEMKALPLDEFLAYLDNDPFHKALQAQSPHCLQCDSKDIRLYNFEDGVVSGHCFKHLTLEEKEHIYGNAPEDHKKFIFKKEKNG